MIAIDGVRPDMILSAALRSDLAPIPYTLEATVRTTPETAAKFKDQAVLLVNGSTPFRIIKSEPAINAAAGTQGQAPFSGARITAFPDGLQALALPRTTAAIMDNVALSGAFRACGATVQVKSGVTLEHFACRAGEIPTFAIARALQEEGAVTMWRAGSIVAMSFADLFAQAPISQVDLESSEDLHSQHLLADQIPVYYSLDSGGSIISAPRTDAAQKLVYVPRKSQHALNNMGRVLVNRQVSNSKLDPTVRAGDILNIKGVPMAVITVAQVHQVGSDGGSQEQYTRIWLGTLSR